MQVLLWKSEEEREIEFTTVFDAGYKETAAAATEEGTFVETERASERRNEMRMEMVMTLLWPSKGRKGEQRMSSPLHCCFVSSFVLIFPTEEPQKIKPWQGS